MINLKKEFDKILDIDKEYNYVIVRHNTTTKCNCWRKESNTADPICPNCEGGGWIFNEWLEKCKLFYATTFRPVAHLHDFYYGKTYTQNFTIYLKANRKTMSIQEGDLVFDIDVTADGRVIDPIIRLRKWLVVDAYNLQTENGKTDFVKIHAKPLTV
jgi:hypothetical protein